MNRAALVAPLLVAVAASGAFGQVAGCRARSDRAPEPARAAAPATGAPRGASPGTQTPPDGAPATKAPPDGVAAASGKANARRRRATPPFTGTAGIVDVPREGAPSVLTAVRAAAHDGFDRVVFEFRGGLPGYHVEYVDRPVRDCGAGEPRPIAGDAWLEVRFNPADAHDEQGRPTVSFAELFPKLPNVIEIERTCDFEAVVTWVLGVHSPMRYRVLELSEPSRLVIDVRHP